MPQQRVHVSLTVSDLARSTDFYRRFLGAEPTKSHDDYTSFRLDTPPLHLSLIPGPTAAVDGGHYGVELFDPAELGSWRERITAAGVSVRLEDDVTCCYARADKVWVEDPDGRHWEVWHRTAEADSLAGDQKTDCCETTCCS